MNKLFKNKYLSTSIRLQCVGLFVGWNLLHHHLHAKYETLFREN